ncbi:hypothetical protein PMAYCL1PPCAC_23347 [Pristionchus mayeri]|uniref:ORC1/DEAH AAA+ ATPase domain-containing protein n=1 Tax=Pristionchus mayeri TaxID=1317129 RepID=A0AAN5D009_9BILA|nr:hypothetical protein PMAYCL1PPCAC_23347 [Pristionchus mayeri]
MVQTRRGRGEEVKQNEGTEVRKSRGRNAAVETVKEKQKTPIKKSSSAIKKEVSPIKKSPIKKMIFTASPGRTTYSSRLKTPTRKEKKDKDVEMEAITNRMDKCVLNMSPPLSQDSAISMSRSLSKSSSSLDSKRDELTTPPPSECTNPSTSSLVTPIVPLRGRENEFHRLVSLIDRSRENKEPLTIYISGTPGTGKSATTGLVLQLLGMAPRKIKTCMVNCTSVTKGDDLCAAIMRSLEMPCPASTAKSKFTTFVTALKNTLVLVLDEADFVEEKMLSSIFTMPATVSPHLIVIGLFQLCFKLTTSISIKKWLCSGIANSIDLTERLLRKIKLKIEVERMVFPRYSKEELALIVSHKMKEEIAEGEGLDSTGIDLCARKVSAVSGDVREVMSIMRQSCLRSRIERVKEEEENMDVGNEKIPSTPKTAPVSLRHINDVARLKYSSALSRSTLQLQPGVLLALCLKLSAGKKKSLTRGTLLNEYRKASSHKEAKWPMVEGSDLAEAFDMLVSQGHISLQGDLIRIQVDSKTARESIRDNEVLMSIDLIL